MEAHFLDKIRRSKIKRGWILNWPTYEDLTRPVQPRRRNPTRYVNRWPPWAAKWYAQSLSGPAAAATMRRSKTSVAPIPDLQGMGIVPCRVILNNSCELAKRRKKLCKNVSSQRYPKRKRKKCIYYERSTRRKSRLVATNSNQDEREEMVIPDYLKHITNWSVLMFLLPLSKTAALRGLRQLNMLPPRRS